MHEPDLEETYAVWSDVEIVEFFNGIATLLLEDEDILVTAPCRDRLMLATLNHPSMGLELTWKGHKVVTYEDLRS